MGIDMTNKGLVLDIDKFATHDGPGIRSAVFLKGCPLACKWCHSPESQKNEPEVIFRANRCARCVKCTGTAELCPTQALHICGRWYTTREIAEIVIKNKPFYANSGGGVTVTGGEPLMQWEFTRQVLALCKHDGIHTALETSGFGSKAALLNIAEVCDLIYFDIKFPASVAGGELHKKYTGAGNKLIWENLAACVQVVPKLDRLKIVVRVPCIPGINDSPEQIAEITRDVKRLGVQWVELMPYNAFAAAKYEWLGREYELADVEPREQAYYNMLSEVVRGIIQR